MTDLIDVPLDIVLAELELAEVGQRGDVPRLVERGRGRGGIGEGEGSGDHDEDGCHILGKITRRHTHYFTPHRSHHSIHISLTAQGNGKLNTTAKSASSLQI